MAGQVAVDVKSSITKTVLELFDTMLSLNVEFSEEDAEGALEGDRMIGALSFAGDVVGSINIQVKDDFARIMTAAMLGMEIEEIESEEEVKDVIREECNIIGGNMKTDFVNAGFSAVISTPSLTIGSDFRVETRNMERYEHMVFRHNEHVMIVEICFKASEDMGLESKLVLKSIDIGKFNSLDMVQSVGDKVIEMFEMMLGMELTLSDIDVPQHTDELHYMGAVDLAGGVDGRVNIRVSEILARIMASKMFEKNLDDIKDDTEIKDIIGEASNIIAGNLKAGFCDSGLDCVISTPSITSGHDFRLETVNMDRDEKFAFLFLEHHIFVQVCVKIDESAGSAAQPGTGSEKDVQTPEAPVEVPEPSLVEASAETVPASTETAPVPGGEPPDPAIETAAARLKKEAISESGALEINQENLDLILDIPLEITVELGRTKMKIDELLKLGPGSAVLLSNLEGEPLNILANEKLVAKGEVVVENEKYGIKITEVVSRLDRIKTL